MYLTVEHKKSFAGIPVLLINNVPYLPTDFIPAVGRMAWQEVEKNQRGLSFPKCDWQKMQLMARKFIQLGKSRQITEPNQ